MCHFCAGTIRVSILCDTIRRDVLGDENVRATAFNIEQEPQRVPRIITEQADGTGDNNNGVVAPQQDGIVNQQESKNDSTIPTAIERSFE